MFFEQDSFGTQVLIPVVGGLVELFATEHVRYALLLYLT